MIKLLQDNWRQSNKSDTKGNLVETFNIDLNSNERKIRTTRTKLIKTGTGETNAFGAVSAIVYFSNIIRVFSGITTGGNLWNGGNSPFDSLTADTTSTTASISNGDAQVFNNEIYTTDGSNLNRYNGSAENSVSSGLTGSTHHLLTKFTPDGSGERLYVSEDDDKVWSVSQANALASSSSYTLDLALEPDYQITVLMAGEQSIWVGVSSASNNFAGGRSIMFEWDGVTANTVSGKYYIDASRIMAGVIKDDIPYIVDSLGRLMVFTGAGFKEIDRFPLNGKTFQATSTNLNQNAIHPRGMAVDGDEILICASNLADGSSGSTVFFSDFPAGVWAWNQVNGLYHKYSPSYQAVADTGVTNLTDWGQFRTAYGGVIEVFEVGNPVASDGGRVMFSMGYFTGSGDNITTGQDIRYGLWTDDTKDNTQKGGYIVSPQIHSSKFMDNWSDIYPSLSNLEISGDLVEIKYRFTDELPTYADITWKSNQTFHTNTDLSDFEQGDEVQIIQGVASGVCSHISTLPSGIGITVTLDNVVTGVSDGDTSVARIQKWKKVGSITDISNQLMRVGNKAHFIQLKVYMQWTGTREFYNLLINNSASINL